MRAFASASKRVLMRTAIVVAAIDDLDLEHVIRLALLLKERLDHCTPALSDVVDPVLVDLPLHSDRLALTIEPLEGCTGFARPRSR